MSAIFSLSLGLFPESIPPGRIISPAPVAATDLTKVRLSIMVGFVIWYIVGIFLCNVYFSG
jgi:hypothetical protein